MNEQEFHYWLPQWILSQIKKKSCTQCGIPYNKEYLISCGIKKTEEGAGLFVEHVCAKCDHSERINFSTELDITLRDVCHMMLKEYQSKQQIEMSKHIRNYTSTSKMTASEVNDFLKFLETSTHEEFMKHIGCTIEEKKKVKEVKKKKAKKKAKKKTRKRVNKPKDSSDKKQE